VPLSLDMIAARAPVRAVVRSDAHAARLGISPATG